MNWIVRVTNGTGKIGLEEHKFESYAEALKGIDLTALTERYEDLDDGIQIFILNSCGVLHFEAYISF